VNSVFSCKTFLMVIIEEGNRDARKNTSQQLYQVKRKD
jgi:hypothetical protein